MPNRSKFTERRRQRLYAILSAGGSRREAAQVAGIDPATLRDWLQRGERACQRRQPGMSGGRWATFYENVQAAEAGQRLVGIPDDDEDELTWAVRYLDRHGWG
jgi:transposase